MTGPRNVTERLNAIVARRSLLEHQFYRAWVAGTLERRHLSLYAAQYWRQVEAFPGYLEALIPRVPLESRRVLADNLHDELDGDHPGLWRHFAAAVGETRLEYAPLWPETRECIDSFKQGIDHGPVIFALGMIYGYESQTPAVAQAKLASLQDLYGVEPHDAEYFALHATLDVEHASQLGDAISDIAGDDEGALQTAEAGAWAGAVAIDGLLNGVWARCYV